MNKELRVIILAAGKGTRMNSDLPKVLHKLHGKALIDYVIDESELLDPKEIILVAVSYTHLTLPTSPHV